MNLIDLLNNIRNILSGIGNYKMPEEEAPVIIELVSREQLKQIYAPVKDSDIEKYTDYLNRYMFEYGVNTYNRICAFLAQIGHESARLRYSEEIASGKAYEGRKDLGNTQPGDGIRFKGRGLIQITGRSNYRDVSAALGYDFINDPAALATPEYAARSACWFWDSRKLNDPADKGTEEAFVSITKKINGGTNGLADRKQLWQKAKTILTEMKEA